MNRLKDKAALVAGGASGIGRSAALLMAEEGARIVVADVNDAGGASVAAAIDQTGGTCRFVHLEVRNEEDWIKAVDGAIGEFGRLDVLSNSAGITMGGRKTMVCKQAWFPGDLRHHCRIVHPLHAEQDQSEALARSPSGPLIPKNQDPVDFGARIGRWQSFKEFRDR